jgi:hypothetical protein
MAVPTNTFQTYQAVGNREDLIDIITNITPVDTWVTSNTGNTRATAVLHEWQTDALAAAAANAVIEGDDAAATAVTPTVRVTNYCQILRKVWQVTDTQNAVQKAGRSSESDYQKMKALKELARDIEYALVINTAAASGASGTARTLKGIQGWIATNVTTGTATANEALTENMLNDNLQLIWAAGGFPSTVLAGAFQKRTISGFSVNTRDIDAADQRVVRSVDVYKSDFGEITIRLHQQVNTTIPSVLLILGDMSLWNKAWLRPVNAEQLARSGSSLKFMAEAELTLESRQELGSGKITQLLTS